MLKGMFGGQSIGDSERDRQGRVDIEGCTCVHQVEVEETVFEDKLAETLEVQQCTAINLGTGVGYSVLDMVKAFEQASGKSVPYKVQARRLGDIAACYANPALAQEVLGWQASRNLQDMCADAWRWQSSNPDGYTG